MFRKFKVLFVGFCFLFYGQFAHADIRLNWQWTGHNGNNIAVTFKDKNHLIISAFNNVKLLKLNKNLYLLYAGNGFKIAINLSRHKPLFNHAKIMKYLPAHKGKFLPIMIFNGSTQMVQGHIGDIILLKDYHRSVTVVSSQNKQHIAIKNALLPMLTTLIKHMPSLPNKQLIDVLKHSEFGLPMRIDNEFVMTKSETIIADKDAYSLDGYTMVGSLNDMVF